MSEFHIDFADASALFIDQSGHGFRPSDPWPPVIVSAEQIADEVERLASLPAPDNGYRSSLIVHSRASQQASGLAPGIQVSLDVLRPGERTKPRRENATAVNFCIRGNGRTVIGDKSIDFKQYDVWNRPSHQPNYRENTGNDLLVCLTYSNTPLLRFMEVWLGEEDAAMERSDASAEFRQPDDPRRKSPYGSFELAHSDAMLMPYELLIAPPPVASPTLHWPWETVEAELKKLGDLGSDYIGRRLYLLYNKMTGRTNGTTPNFFATITIRPPKIVDRPHRHVSAAINYYFKGSGRSVVAGKTYEWKAGDLMLSAPGWAVHNHASYDEPVYELTVQDQPLNIAMESLLWQEDLKREPSLLGVSAGFQTNRKAISA